MRRLALLALHLALAACVSPAAHVVEPPAFAPRDQTTSMATRSEAEPLIVEWPSSARAKLEALAQRSMVVVHYQGREMEVLAGCRALGTYGYRPITRKRDTLTITTEDELFAKLPQGAARLAGELHAAGALGVDMTIVGRYQADVAGVDASSLRGDCARATHVVTALTAGAFRFYAAAHGDLGAQVGPVAGARSQATTRMLAEDGDESACAGASPSDAAPPGGCGAVIRRDLTPRGGGTQSMAACPAGTTWSGSGCVAAQVSCPAGSTWDGAACVGAAPAPPPPPAPAAAAPGRGFFCYRVERKHGEPRIISSCFGDRAMCEAGRDHDSKVPEAKSVTPCSPRPMAACFYLHRSMHCYEAFGECSAVAEGWQPNDGCDNYEEYDVPTSGRRPVR
jgi:hypothetical protein